MLLKELLAEVPGILETRGNMDMEIGMMPGITGTVIPASRILYRKLYRRLLSKNICVVRNEQPASTFSFR